MKIFLRIRILLFALIVLGSFANFAQNEWGNKLITVCEALITFVFFTEGILHLKNRMKIGKLYTEGSFYENFCLGFLFLGFVMKNMWWPGATPVLILSIFLLLPFYIIQIVKFYKNNKPKGILLVSLLTVGSITTLILGISILFKIQHWPGAIVMYYAGFGLTLVMIAGSAKWNFDYDGKKINVLSALGLLKNNIIVLYFLTFSVSTFGIMGAWGYAPKFQNLMLPQVIEKGRSSGDAKAIEKAQRTIENYIIFEQESMKNGFIE